VAAHLELTDENDAAGIDTGGDEVAAGAAGADTGGVSCPSATAGGGELFRGGLDQFLACEVDAVVTVGAVADDFTVTDGTPDYERFEGKTVVVVTSTTPA